MNPSERYLSDERHAYTIIGACLYLFWNSGEYIVQSVYEIGSPLRSLEV